MCFLHLNQTLWSYNDGGLARQVERLGDTRNEYTVLIGNPEVKRHDRGLSHRHKTNVNVVGLLSAR